MTNWTPRAANQITAPPVPDITNLALLPDGTLSFSVPTAVNRIYRIDFKDNLDALLWTPLSTNRAVGASLAITDGATNRSQRFYRAVFLP